MTSVRRDLAPPGANRREQRKHVTRRELLVAGRRLFGEQGLYDSRIEDLSRHAGIAKGTLYGYFGNKEELLEAVVRAGFAELLEQVRKAAAGTRSREGRVERVVAAHLRFFASNPDLLRIFHQVRGLLKFDRPEAPALRRVLRRYVDDVGAVLVPDVGAAQERRGAFEAASLLFGAASGVFSMRAVLAPPAGRGPIDPRVVRALAALVPARAAPKRTSGAARRPVVAARLDRASRRRVPAPPAARATGRSAPSLD